MLQIIKKKLILCKLDKKKLIFKFFPDIIADGYMNSSFQILWKWER